MLAGLDPTLRNWSPLVKNKLSAFVLRTFQFLAYAEGALLPSILLVAIINWMTGSVHILVAIIGATHGTVFTLYLFFVPFVARILDWPAKTISVAFSVAFVPFATWNFEKQVRPEIQEKLGSAGSY